jgi:hypothetical protein
MEEEHGVDPTPVIQQKNVGGNIARLGEHPRRTVPGAVPGADPGRQPDRFRTVTG